MPQQPNGNTPPDGEDIHLLTTAEVAALFRVSVHTVQKWKQRGKLRSVSPSPQHRFREDEVLAFLNGSAS